MTSPGHRVITIAEPGQQTSRDVTRSILALVIATCEAISLWGCGCAASPERKTERAAATPDRQQAWGASFTLSPGWSGGENDAGGYEFTDGLNALMVGRHALAKDTSLDAFADERARALRDVSASESLTRTEQHFGAARAMVLSGRGAGGVEIRLLVARLSAEAGLSLMMLADARTAPQIDAEWAKLLASLDLPAG